MCRIPTARAFRDSLNPVYFPVSLVKLVPNTRVYSQLKFPGGWVFRGPQPPRLHANMLFNETEYIVADQVISGVPSCVCCCFLFTT